MTALADTEQGFIVTDVLQPAGPTEDQLTPETVSKVRALDYLLHG